jgi:phage-related protein
MSLNEYSYNEAAYNEGAADASAIAPTSLLTFDGYNCDDRTNMTISLIKFNSGHNREIDQFNVPRANGVRVANVYEREKIIQAYGKLDAADADSMETLIDTVKKNLRTKRAKLVTVWGGKTRVYQKATLVNMNEIFADRKGHHIDMVPFTLEFLCEDLSTDWGYTVWTGEITAAEDTVAASGDGTIEGKPVIIVVFSAATGVTSLTVEIDENGNTIGYEGAIAAGDALVFDCESQTVTLNGTSVDFVGYFPEMPLDTATFRFTTDGSSRTFRATIKSKHAYL